MDSKKQTALTIAMLGSYPPLRALSSYCYEFANSVAERTPVTFMSFDSIYPKFLYPGGGLEADLTFPAHQQPGLTVHRRLSWYNPVTWIAAGWSTKADLLHAQWWSLPLFAVYLVICSLFKLRKKPVIFTVHNVLSHEKSVIYDILSRILFSLGDHFIVHTENNVAQMIRHYGIPRENITKIPHGPLDFQALPQVDRESARKEMGIQPHHKAILLFGAIRPYKGIDTALKAFAKVHSQMPDTRLIIAGKLWQDWEPYHQLITANQLEDCTCCFLDYIPSGSVSRFFTAADLVVLPYRHFDSQSGIAATSLSFRKPLIVTNVGGLPDLVENKRYILPPDNPDALARAMVYSLRQPGELEAMTRAAHNIAAQITWPAIARRTTVMYTEVLKRTLNGGRGLR